jgi:6-phospho-3-hexuloisomerase
MNFQTLSQTVLQEHAQVFRRIDPAQLRLFMDAIKNAQRIFLVGGGREGIATRAFAMRLMHMGKEAHWVWDDTVPAMGPGDLFILTSGPGNVGHVHYLAGQGRAAGAALAVVTGVPDEMTPALADVVLWVPASVYHGKGDLVPSIQPMGNLFEQSLFMLFDFIIILLRDELGLTAEAMEARHRNIE